MLRKVVLYGAMGRQFGRVHHFDIGTPAEAIRALRGNFGAKFDRYLFRNRDSAFRVLLDDEPADAERLQQPVGKETIRIVPLIYGAKSAIGQVIIGAILIALVFVPGMQWAAPYLIPMGVGLIMGGVSQMLFSPPTLDDSYEPVTNRPSFAFSGPVNTTAQGNCVAVGYGRLIVGSQVVSAGFFCEDLSAPVVGVSPVAGQVWVPF